MASNTPVLPRPRKSRVCKTCEERKPMFYCGTCKLNLCKICQNIHKKIKENADHVVIGSLCIPNFLKERCTIKCTEHNGKELQFFCEKCEKLVCDTCKRAHINHSLVPLEDAREVLQSLCRAETRVLMEDSQELMSILENLDVYKNSCNRIEQNLCTLRRAVENCVNTTTQVEINKITKFKGVHVNEYETQIKCFIEKFENCITKISSVRSQNQVDVIKQTIAESYNLKQEAKGFSGTLSMTEVRSIHKPTQEEVEDFKFRTKDFFSISKDRGAIQYPICYEFVHAENEAAIPVGIHCRISGLDDKDMSLILYAEEGIYKVNTYDFGIQHYKSNLNLKEMITLSPSQHVVVDENNTIKVLDNDFRVNQSIGRDCSMDGYTTSCLIRGGTNRPVFFMCYNKRNPPCKLLLHEYRLFTYSLKKRRAIEIDMECPCTQGVILSDQKHIVVATDEDYYQEFRFLYKINLQKSEITSTLDITILDVADVGCMYADMFDKVLLGDHRGNVHLLSANRELHYLRSVLSIGTQLAGISILYDSLFICSYNEDSKTNKIQKYPDCPSDMWSADSTLTT